MYNTDINISEATIRRLLVTKSGKRTSWRDIYFYAVLYFDCAIN